MYSCLFYDNLLSQPIRRIENVFLEIQYLRQLCSGEMRFGRMNPAKLRNLTKQLRR